MEPGKYFFFPRASRLDLMSQSNVAFFVFSVHIAIEGGIYNLYMSLPAQPLCDPLFRSSH